MMTDSKRARMLHATEQAKIINLQMISWRAYKGILLTLQQISLMFGRETFLVMLEWNCV